MIKRKCQEQPLVQQSNFRAFQKFADTSDEILRGLKMSGPEAGKRNPWKIYLLLSRVDHETRLAWARHTRDETFPAINTFIAFQNQRCDDFEACISSERKLKGSKQNKSITINRDFIYRIC